VIENVTASGNELVSAKRLCPQKLLDERRAIAASESGASERASHEEKHRIGN
jgi:hypothetical protein